MEQLFDINMPSEAILIYEEITTVRSIHDLDKDDVILKAQRFLYLISEGKN